MTTQLISLEKEFANVSMDVKALDAQDYKRAGFTKASKLIKAAKFGYRFCHRNHIKKWVSKAAEKAQREHGYNGKSNNDSRLNIRPDGVWPSSLFTTALMGRWGNSSEIASEQIRINPYESIEIAIDSCKLEEYSGVPPVEVVEKVNEAKKAGCFDSMIVLYPTCKRVIDDPIVVGQLNGFPDFFFFICGWVADLFNPEDVAKQSESDRMREELERFNPMPTATGVMGRRQGMVIVDEFDDGSSARAVRARDRLMRNQEMAYMAAQAMMVSPKSGIIQGIDF